MAFIYELKAVFIYVGRVIRDLFDGDSRTAGRYGKFIATFVGVGLVSFAGYKGYRIYIVSQEQAAHQSFVEYFESFQAAQKANSAQEWERMVTVLDKGYTQYKGRNLAPLFLSLKADAQLQLGKRIESINTLQQAIDSLAKNSPLFSLLATKLALMQLDTADDALSKVGLAQLVLLARDDKNSLKDMALFYLGRYYWANDQIDEAKKAWQELEDSSWIQKAYPSPWVVQAKELLQQFAA